MKLDLDLQVWVALIEAVGIVIGGIATPIVVYILGRRAYPKKIDTFSERGHDVSRMMDRATKSIYIISQIGDVFLKEHQLDLEKYLNSNKDIVVRYLILSKKKFMEMQNYTGNHCDLKARKETINRLKKLCKKYPGRFLFSKFDQIITTSYIAVDIDNVGDDGKWGYTSKIQCMPYQYSLNTTRSFIVYLSPKIGKEKFGDTVDCIMDMWRAGRPVKI